MSLDSAKTQNPSSSIDRHGLLSRFRGDWPQIIAWVLVLLYIVTFTWLAIQRHASFNSSGFDLGIYDQVGTRCTDASFSTPLPANRCCTYPTTPTQSCSW
jgi:hypothetical protein